MCLTYHARVCADGATRSQPASCFSLSCRHDACATLRPEPVYLHWGPFEGQVFSSKQKPVWLEHALKCEVADAATGAVMEAVRGGMWVYPGTWSFMIMGLAVSDLSPSHLVYCGICNPWPWQT